MSNVLSVSSVQTLSFWAYSPHRSVIAVIPSNRSEGNWVRSLSLRFLVKGMNNEIRRAAGDSER